VRWHKQRPWGWSGESSLGGRGSLSDKRDNGGPKAQSWVRGTRCEVQPAGQFPRTDRRERGSGGGPLRPCSSSPSSAQQSSSTELGSGLCRAPSCGHPQRLPSFPRKRKQNSPWASGLTRSGLFLFHSSSHPWFHSPTPVPQASLLFLEHVMPAPTPGPLHMIFLCQITVQLMHSFHSGLCSNVPSSKRPF
jgi:hypothetical protein